MSLGSIGTYAVAGFGGLVAGIITSFMGMKIGSTLKNVIGDSSLPLGMITGSIIPVLALQHEKDPVIATVYQGGIIAATIICISTMTSQTEGEAIELSPKEELIIVLNGLAIAYLVAETTNPSVGLMLGSLAVWMAHKHGVEPTLESMVLTYYLLSKALLERQSQALEEL